MKLRKYHYRKLNLKLFVQQERIYRSLANDFGKALGTGAYLSSLRRTSIGNFLVDDALSPQQFEEKIEAMKLHSERQTNT